MAYNRTTPLKKTNKVIKFFFEGNEHQTHIVMTSQIPYHNHTRLIGAIHEACDIDIPFDIMFKSYGTVSHEYIDGITNVISIITLDIYYTPSNVIITDYPFALYWNSITGAVFTHRLKDSEETIFSITVELTYEWSSHQLIEITLFHQLDLSSGVHFNHRKHFLQLIFCEENFLNT